MIRCIIMNQTACKAIPEGLYIGSKLIPSRSSVSLGTAYYLAQPIRGQNKSNKNILLPSHSPDRVFDIYAQIHNDEIKDRMM